MWRYFWGGVIPLETRYNPFLEGYAAAAKSLQLCPTLCNPVDGSPPGSPIPGILQRDDWQWICPQGYSWLALSPSLPFPGLCQAWGRVFWHPRGKDTPSSLLLILLPAVTLLSVHPPIHPPLPSGTPRPPAPTPTPHHPTRRRPAVWTETLVPRELWASYWIFILKTQPSFPNILGPLCLIFLKQSSRPARYTVLWFPNLNCLWKLTIIHPMPEP